MERANEVRPESKPKPRRFLKIIYSDLRTDKILETTIEFTGMDYYETLPYMENVQMAVGEIWEEGGFWLDEKTIIPISRVLEYRTVPEEKVEAPKPKTRPKTRPRRRPRNNQPGKKTQESAEKNGSH